MADNESDEFDRPEDDDSQERKPLSEYDTYQEYLDEEVMQDELIVGPEEDTLEGLLIKGAIYLLSALILLSVIALLLYVVAEMLIYIAEYTSDNLSPENFSQSVLLFMCVIWRS